MERLSVFIRVWEVAGDRMSERTVVVVVVAVALLGAVAPAVAAPSVDAMGSASGAAQAANNTTNDSTSLGASISGFMQTSEANAEGEVDDEVFRGRFAGASNESRRVLVAARGEELENRLERLRAQRAELLDGTGNLTVGERARAARLLAEIDSLHTAINTTDEAAAEAGVNATRLSRLRENASDLDGPEVAELARGLAGHGPPEDRGPDRDTENNTTDTDDGGPDDARRNGNGNGNGPPSASNGNGAEAGDEATTVTATPTPTPTDSENSEGGD